MYCSPIIEFAKPRNGAIIYMFSGVSIFSLLLRFLSIRFWNCSDIVICFEFFILLYNQQEILIGNLFHLFKVIKIWYGFNNGIRHMY
jgi:hypothetical protein